MAPTATGGSAGTSPNPTTGGTGTDSGGTGVTAGADSGGTPPNGGSGTTIDTEKPMGTIPNTVPDGVKVGIPVDQWEDGLVSPTFLKGKSLTQPTAVNGYLMISGNEEFWMYDISNPSMPREVWTEKTPGARGGEAESHTVSYARYGNTFYMVTLSGTGIDTWDVTTPATAKHVGQVAIPGTSYGDYTEAIWGVSWQGQYIYVGATNNGVKVVDVADPAKPKLVGQLGTSSFSNVKAGPVDVIGNVLVLTTPKENGGVATLDITDPIAPKPLSSFSSGKSYIGQFHRHYAFLISPLRVWDVLTNPGAVPTQPLATMNHGGAEYLSFGDDYLFLGHVRKEIGGTPGASKIDVSDVKAMKLESTIYGRQNLANKNDDQFTLALGPLLVLADDQAPYAGWVLAAHQLEADTKAPIVDTVIPRDKEMASTQARIGVTFSDNIELASINSKSFIVREVGGEALPGIYGLRMGVVNFDPTEDLKPGTTYEVVLPKGGIADYVGNTLATEWKSTFTTK